MSVKTAKVTSVPGGTPYTLVLEDAFPRTVGGVFRDFTKWSEARRANEEANTRQGLHRAHWVLHNNRVSIFNPPDDTVLIDGDVLVLYAAHFGH